MEQRRMGTERSRERERAQETGDTRRRRMSTKFNLLWPRGLPSTQLIRQLLPRLPCSDVARIVRDIWIINSSPELLKKVGLIPLSGRPACLEELREK